MLQKSFLTGEWIFFAEDRANRPYSAGDGEYDCPFCLSNESMTPPNIYCSENKRIRIFDNLYPFVAEGYGVHQVLVDTDLHNERLHEFSYEHIFDVLSVFKRHTQKLNENHIYTQIFKNEGTGAGASQIHSHWQVAALNVLPPRIKETIRILKDYYEKNNKCYFCDLDLNGLIIEENELFYAFAPHTPKFSYEIHISPKEHAHGITCLDDNAIKSLSRILKHTLVRLNNIYKNLPYNICFYSSPVIDGVSRYVHFYIQIIPRTGSMAGFEFSTGCYINSVPPEKAAAVLRGAYGE